MNEPKTETMTASLMRVARLTLAKVRAGLVNQQRAVDHYDRLAPRYDAGRFTWLTRHDIETICDLLRPSPGDTLLDAGCGTGVLSRWFAEHGLKVCAVDLSSRMIEQVSPHVAEVHRADIAALDLGARFDCIVCNGVLEFVPSPESCVEVLAGHLREGGRLVVVVPRLSLLGLAYHLRQRLRFGIHTRLFRRRSFASIGPRCGLREVRVRYPFLHTIAYCWTRDSIDGGEVRWGRESAASGG